MDEERFRHLIARTPFGGCSDSEWRDLTKRLLDSLSRFLSLPLEFAGGRLPSRDSFCPIVRSVGLPLSPLDLRMAGMLSCSTHNRQSRLRIDALLFLFVDGVRVAPPGSQFIIYDYLGPEGLEWVWSGWQNSDFSDEWDPYTFRWFFGGAEHELPGCSPDADEDIPHDAI
jgi:hypothetical protein